MKTKNIKQTVMFKASPHELYEMIIDSKKHSAFTGDRAEISRVIGDEFTAYGGWIRGKNLKLVPDQLIVQSWRGEDWPAEHYSEVTFRFTKTKNGTKLSFVQTDVPADKYAEINNGWQTEYWDKIKEALN